MTADERIERLVNRFGQTISDLPKPHKVEMGKQCYAYPVKHYPAVGKAVEAWLPFDSKMPTGLIIGRYKDYICHLCDVIDRMEAALETATQCAGCARCSKDEYYGQGRCDLLADCDLQINDNWFQDDEVDE